MADQPSGRERVDRAIDLMWATFQEPPFWAAMELWTAARTDPDLRAALRSEERRLRAAIRAVADEHLGPGDRRRARCTRSSASCCSPACAGWRMVYAFEDRPAATDPHLAALEAAGRPDARPRQPDRP